ncbi:MAG: acyltransferase domain-containing protein [Acidobacteria bacterium]|jgi:acyl transferase domain-containing protein|nr:acyltransferase domain-containing protein [Acidobacteriota bacterium]
MISKSGESEITKTALLGNKSWQLLMISAKTQDGLQKRINDFKDYLISNPGLELSDAVFTLADQEFHYPYRMALVSSGTAAVIDALTRMAPQEVQTRYAEADCNRPVVFMFAGQGSQYVDIGLGLYREEAIFRENVDKCLEIIGPLLGWDIKKILYPGLVSGDIAEAKKKINEIEIANLVAFIIEYALASLLIKWGIIPAAMIGYSLGEYIAACISGVLSLEDALKMVVLRGKMICNMPPGAMLSVPLEKEQIFPFIENKNLSLAIDNGISCVAAGALENTRDLEKELIQKRIFPMWVNSSHAPHSLLMEPILDKFAAETAKLTLNKPKIPYISNVTGDWITGQEVVDPTYWASHLRRTVLFSNGLQRLSEIPGALFIEIGPGRDLSILLKRYIDDKERIIDTIRHSQRGIDDVYFLLNRIARLWLWGIKISRIN